MITTMPEETNTNTGSLDSQISSLEEKVTAQGRDPLMEGPASIFDKSREDEFDAELGKVWDRQERREEARPQMAPPPEGATLDDTMSRVWDWQSKSASEKRVESEASKELAALKAAAEKYGVSLGEAQHVLTNEMLKANTEYGEVGQHLKGAFKDSS